MNRARAESRISMNKTARKRSRTEVGENRRRPGGSGNLPQDQRTGETAKNREHQVLSHRMHDIRTKSETKTLSS